jgi:hypothetical protein
MKEFPDKLQLDIMWSVATSSSIETGTRPQYGFAQMLYDYITDKKPLVELGPYEPQRKKSTSQET